MKNVGLKYTIYKYTIYILLKIRYILIIVIY